MTIEEYGSEHRKMISAHAQSAIKKYNEFHSKTPENLAISIEVAMCELLFDFRELDKQPITPSKPNTQENG